MTRWREDNTEGFDAAGLAALNAAQGRLEAMFPEADAENLADLLNNAWAEGATEGSLVGAVARRLSPAA